MFVYSLAGLKLEDSGAQDAVEIEENETTARSSVYQVLGHLVSPPDDEHYEKARDGRWAKELAKASELLPFTLDIAEVSIPEGVSLADHQAEFQGLFGDDGSRLCGGAYTGNGARAREEAVRFYEYYGLAVALEDERAADHLATGCDFMQYITYKEAATPSPRLARSFRRAQLDFLDRQLGTWVPQIVAAVEATDPSPFFGWAVGLTGSFVEADHAYVRQLLDA